MATVSNSIITKDGTRGTFSWDPDSLSVAASFTDSDGAKYTQNLDDGNFFKSDGTWLGAENQLSVKEAFGQSANIELVDPDIRKTLDKYATNLNVFGTNDDGGGNTEDGKDEGEALTVQNVETNTRNQNKRRSYSNFKDLRYPVAKLADDADFMRITMLEYQPGQFKSGSKASERKTTSLGSVILPIPPGLADTNTVSWNQHTMNELQMAGGQAAMGVMNSNNFFKGMADGANELLTQAQNQSGALKQLAQIALVGQIPGINATTNQLLARDQGQILNPNMELLFNGPALRSFTYSFRLTARNEKETHVIRRIIRFFKQGMSVKKSPGGNLFLDSPNVFDACFHAGYNNVHPFLYKMKRTALTSFGVNYVPDGTYMTLPNSSMTAYEIQLTMQELDPIFDDDYTNDNDESVGF